MRGCGCRARVRRVFNGVFANFSAFYVKACSKNFVKYGIRCEEWNALSQVCWYFTVVLAFHVKACSETLVKYDTRGAFTVVGHAFTWFFTVFLIVYFKGLSENLVKHAVLQLFI